VFQLIVVFVLVTFLQKLFHVHITKYKNKILFLEKKKTSLLDVIILDVHHERLGKIYQILQNDMDLDDQVQLIDETSKKLWCFF